MIMNWRLAYIYLLTVSCCYGYDLRSITGPCQLGEGPHWDADQNLLYYVDSDSSLVLRFDPATGKQTQVYLGGKKVGFVLTVAGTNDQFVVGLERDLVTFRWDGISSEPTDVRVLASVEPDRPHNRFNDAKADSRGRLWAGTFAQDHADGNAALYLFQPNKNFDYVKKCSATVSNGLIWNDDDTKLYYIESLTKNVDVFDYNATTAEISNRRILFNTIENGLDGVPDGMTIDADGNLWVVVIEAGAVAHINALTGELINRYDMPTKYVTSCVWGGRDLDTLFITSRDGLHGNKKDNPSAGTLFALTNTGIRGQKSNKVKLNNCRKIKN